MGDPWKPVPTYPANTSMNASCCIERAVEFPSKRVEIGLRNNQLTSMRALNQTGSHTAVRVKRSAHRVSTERTLLRGWVRSKKRCRRTAVLSSRRHRAWRRGREKKKSGHPAAGLSSRHNAWRGRRNSGRAQSGCPTSIGRAWGCQLQLPLWWPADLRTCGCACLDSLGYVPGGHTRPS